MAASGTLVFPLFGGHLNWRRIERQEVSDDEAEAVQAVQFPSSSVRPFFERVKKG